MVASKTSPTRRAGLVVALGLAGLVGSATPACSSSTDGSVNGGPGGTTQAACVSPEQYFAEKVWAPVLAPKCVACHNPQGAAKGSGLVYRSSSEAGFLSANLAVLKDVAALEKGGTSILLLKPTGQLDHGGGKVIEKDGPEYQALATLVEKLGETSSCATDVSAYFEGISLSGAEATLRKAALVIAGRLPTEVESKAVRDGGLPALDAVLDALMKEDAFFDLLKTTYNDMLLTDRYLGGEQATGLVGALPGYDPYWYKKLDDPTAVKTYGASDAKDLEQTLAERTNRAIAREPLELVAHVVKNDRPFGEILTADYLLVNPYSAAAWGAKVTFKDPTDPNEWVEAKIATRPQAGILTSPMFLNRHPTTATNRNRHRANVLYKVFLGTDILKTAERPLDPTKISDFNPTMNNPACVVCHANIDPIAGAFHSFDYKGVYDANDKWLDDMRPPGFGSEQVPYDQFPTSIQWLGSRVAQDARFSLAAVFAVYHALTGQTPMTAPTDPTQPDYAASLHAYLGQYYTFDAIAKEFEASKQNLKVVVKGIVKSPYFRAVNLPAEPSGDDVPRLAELGTGRFLPPEALNDKITSLLGFPWRPNFKSRDWLLDQYQYRILYGGIDSGTIISRITSPNGVMANVADRMANEMACLAVPHDFFLPKEKRALFPYVDVTYEPEDANGFPVGPARAAIRENIRHLHARLLGEWLDDSDPEIERTYELFHATWKEGKDKMAAVDPTTQKPVLPKNLPWACTVQKDYWTDKDLPDAQKLVNDETYTIRAWMAVVSYMLGDWAFLSE
jgi:hypothetical protein